MTTPAEPCRECVFDPTPEVTTCTECGNDDVCEGHLYCSDCLEVVA